MWLAEVGSARGEGNVDLAVRNRLTLLSGSRSLRTAQQMAASSDPEQSLTFALLYGPVVQFASTPGQNAPSVVAMPPQLPLSVDIVFQHPPDAVLPDNLAHFCFAPLQKLQVRHTHRGSQPCLDRRFHLKELSCARAVPPNDVARCLHVPSLTRAISEVERTPFPPPTRRRSRASSTSASPTRAASPTTESRCRRSARLARHPRPSRSLMGRSTGRSTGRWRSACSAAARSTRASRALCAR